MNKQIVTSALVITASGVANSFVNKQPITRIIMGGYIFLLVLSLADMLGGPISKLASALSMVAVVYVLLNVFPWSTIMTTLGYKTGK